MLNLKLPMDDGSTSDLSEAAQIRFLTPENTSFKETPGHTLSIKVDNEEYSVVYLYCSFPHTNNKVYISVRTDEDREIGIIRSINTFPKNVERLLEKHIKIRYFTPNITNLNKIKEEFGYTYWEVETDAGYCSFVVRSAEGNIKMVSKQKVLITDVDGNRFSIENINQLSDKDYRMIEMYIQ